VVDVPVEDTNTFSCLPRGSGRNSDIIEKAEACGLLALSMVTWRPHYAITSLKTRLLVKYLPQTQDRRLRRQQRCLVTPLGVVNILLSICRRLHLFQPLTPNLYCLSIFLGMT